MGTRQSRTHRSGKRKTTVILRCRGPGGHPPTGGCPTGCGTVEEHRPLHAGGADAVSTPGPHRRKNTVPPMRDRSLRPSRACVSCFVLHLHTQGPDRTDHGGGGGGEGAGRRPRSAAPNHGPTRHRPPPVRQARRPSVRAPEAGQLLFHQFPSDIIRSGCPQSSECAPLRSGLPQIWLSPARSPAGPG